METPHGPAPHRRVRLRLDLDADDWPSLVRALETLAFDVDTRPGIPDGLIERVITSGGAGSGFVATLTEDATMTPERYREARDAWLARARRAREGGA